MFEFFFTRPVASKQVVHKNPEASSPENANSGPEENLEQKPIKGDPIGDLKDVVHLVLVVLFIGFAALLVTVIFGAGALFATYEAQKQASYEELSKDVIEQNTKMDLLIEEYGRVPVSSSTPPTGK